MGNRLLDALVFVAPAIVFCCVMLWALCDWWDERASSLAQPARRLEFNERDTMPIPITVDMTHYEWQRAAEQVNLWPQAAWQGLRRPS